MIATIVAMALAAQAADAAQLRPGLEPLGFLVGHCWQGDFPSGERDTHCFEPVYGGQHVRDRHEVTGGQRVYRGESLYSAQADGTVDYTYWNSIGGVSRGTMRAAGDRLDFGDESYEGPDGRRISIATHWRRTGEDRYEAVSASAEAPSMNRTVVYRRVGEAVTIREEVAPDGSRTLVHEIALPVPAVQAWAAVSTAEGWTGWAVPVAWREGDLLETSYAPTAARGDPTTIQQRILAEVPGRLIVFRTVKAPEGFPHFETFRGVIHALSIEAEGEGRTRVRLVSSGYPDDAAGRQLAGFFRDGNRVSLERLRQRFVSGPVDWSRVAQAAQREGR